MTSVIIYPSFLKFQDFTFDDYWKDIFLDCACNKFPRGMRYDGKKGVLFLRIPIAGGRSKTEVINLPEEPDKAYRVLIRVFHEKLNMYSTHDLQVRKEEFDENQERYNVNLDCEWKKLKPRSIKDVLIMNYVTQLKERYSLPPKEAKKLLDTINLGFQLKYFNSDDVVYKDRQIVELKGLEYNEKENSFQIVNTPHKVNKSEKNATSQRFNQSIDRFLREYRTRRLIFT